MQDSATTHELLASAPTRVPGPLLLVCVNFPSPRQAEDGQGIYVLRAAMALAPLVQGPIQVLALRFGSQRAREKVGALDVERVSPPRALGDVFQLYDPPHFLLAMEALRRGVIRHMDHELPPPLSAWCHGYETGAIAAELAARGLAVLGVLHYSVALESLHDLALADDAVRREALASRRLTAISRACPPPLRPPLLRVSQRWAHRARRLPLPPWVGLQLEKLHLERQLLRHGGLVMAVGRHFAAELATCHPQDAAVLRWCHAGAPTALPAPVWPMPPGAHRLRLVMAGRPTGQKGWDYAAEALHLLERRWPALAARLDLLVMGGLGEWGGPYSTYSHNVARRLRGLRIVRWQASGLVPHRDVLAALGAAHCLCLPSVFEPFGLVVLEAMAAGCMVLASDAAGPSDLLRPPWGLRMPFHQPRRRVDAVLRGLLDLLSLSAGELERRGHRARADARHYTWAACAQAHAQALLEAGHPADRPL